MALSFEAWMKAVDEKVQGKVGLSVHDLPDIAFAELHDDGISPAAAAKLALQEAGW